MNTFINWLTWTQIRKDDLMSGITQQTRYRIHSKCSASFISHQAIVLYGYFLESCAAKCGERKMIAAFVINSAANTIERLGF
jgi:hypothetical protein